MYQILEDYVLVSQLLKHREYCLIVYFDTFSTLAKYWSIYRQTHTL